MFDQDIIIHKLSHDVDCSKCHTGNEHLYNARLHRRRKSNHLMAISSIRQSDHPYATRLIYAI